MTSLKSFTCRFMVGLAVLFGFSGCDKDASTSSTSKPSGGSLKMAFVTNNSSDFWNIAKAGVNAYEKEAGVKVDIFLPKPTVEDQNRIVENLISQGYQAIAISPNSPKDQASDLNAAAKKAKIICFDSDAPESDRLCYIGSDNFEAGQMLGKEIVKLLPDGGKIAIFVGRFSADNAKRRLDGIEDSIKGHKIEIAVKLEDGTDRNKAITNVENVINGYPDVKLLCGLWSYNGPAIATAINSSGKKGKILAAVFDEEDGTLDAIADGVILCTVVQSPYKFGYESSKMMHALLTTGNSVIPASKSINTGVHVVDSKDVATFRAELNKLKSGK